MTSNNTIQLKDLKPGTFFKRKETAKRVFIREHFNRKTKYGAATIWCNYYDDAFDGIYLKPTTLVFINFEY